MSRPQKLIQSYCLDWASGEAVCDISGKKDGALLLSLGPQSDNEIGEGSGGFLSDWDPMDPSSIHG